MTKRSSRTEPADQFKFYHAMCTTFISIAFLTSTSSAFVSNSGPNTAKLELHHAKKHVRLFNVPILYRKLTSIAASNNYGSPSDGFVDKSKKKRKRKSKVGPIEKKGESSVGISEEDLANHVSNIYIHGPRGILRKRTKGQRGRSGRTSDPKSKSMTSFSSSVVSSTSNDFLPSMNERSDTSVFDRYPALVLNADYQPLSSLPLSLWNWQDAVKAIFSGKVTVVDVYPDIKIRAASIEVPLPAVIALNDYVKPPKQIPAFTKRNVFLRDEYRCQYCNHRFHTCDLSIDHVHPRSLGGRLTWDNAVTSCNPCNGKKGSLRVEELSSVGMRLLRKPFVPTQMQLASIAGRMKPSRGVHPTWEPFLGIMPEPTPKSSKATESAPAVSSQRGS